jgi:hypothetical protein
LKTNVHGKMGPGLRRGDGSTSFDADENGQAKVALQLATKQ